MGALDTVHSNLKVPPANGAPTVTPPPAPPVAAAKAVAGFDTSKQPPPPDTTVAPNTDAMARNIANGAASLVNGASTVAGMVNPANMSVGSPPVANAYGGASLQGMKDVLAPITNPISNAASGAWDSVKSAAGAGLDAARAETARIQNLENNPAPAGTVAGGINNTLSSVKNSLLDAGVLSKDILSKDTIQTADQQHGRLLAGSPEGRVTNASIVIPPASAGAPPPAVSSAPTPTAPTVTPAPAPTAAAPAAPGPAETGARAFTMANGQRMITNVDGNSNAVAGLSGSGMQAPGAPQPVLQNVGAAGSPFGGSAQQQLANIQALRANDPAPQAYQPPQKTSEQLEREDRDHRWGLDNLRLAAERTPALANAYAAQANAMASGRNAQLQADTAAGMHKVQARGQDVTARTTLQTHGMDNQTKIATTGMNNDTTVQTHGMDNATRMATTGMNNETSLATTNLNNRSAQQVADIQGQSHLASAHVNADAHRDVETQRGANQMKVEQFKADNAPAGYHAPTLPGQAPVFTGAGGMYRYVDAKGNVINGRLPTKAELAAKTK